MTIDRPFGRVTVFGLWAVPVWALSLLIGTITHQPPPQTDMADWSRYVTTDTFLVSHLVASILGGAIGVIGVISLALVLANRGGVRLSSIALVLGVLATSLLSALFGIAAWAQPAIGRLYLAGEHGRAVALYYDQAQPPWLVAAGLAGVVALATSVLLLGIAVARSGWLPRWAGIGFAISGPLFAIVGFVLDDFIETIATALMLASSTWIAIAAWRVPRAPDRQDAPPNPLA